MSAIRHIPKVAAAAVAVLYVLAIAGCGGDGDDTTTGEAKQSVGKGEGKLNLVAWASYVEDGSNDPNADWVTPFEKKTGCKVSVKIGNTSDEMVQLMRTGQYDGVSASGNASVRLIDGGDVDPVNVDLVPNYKTVFDDLKNTDYNSRDGVNYGIPHGRGANLLIWNKNEVKPDPDSWGVILDPKQAAKYKGKISVYDDPIYIADAAVYLKTHQPDLGIEDPYELDEKQFNAAVDLLKKQHPNVGEYWADYAKQISSFTNGDSVVGTTWQYQHQALLAEGEPIEASPSSTDFLPKEDATGWSDTWMLSSEAKHPNCMYLWMNHIISPQANADVAEYFGEAPAQSLSCEAKYLNKGPFPDPNHCKAYHADDPGFWKQVYFWKTPLAECGDDRGTECKNYNDWVQAWTEIKG